MNRIIAAYKRRPKLRESTWFKLIAAVAFGIWLSDHFGWFAPVPFENVQVESVTREGGGVRVVATYDKTGCTILQAVVFGTVAGDRDPLPYTPQRGPNQSFERFEGPQVSDVLIRTQGIEYERFEMLTRHNCDGHVVDRVFFDVEAP